VKTEPANG